jgi:RNA polymerase sigma factor (sigma-70 family)
MVLNTMENDLVMYPSDASRRVEQAYRSERPRFLARLRAAGRTLEEAEDIIHDVYAETMERLHLVSDIHNLPAWINTLFSRRLIDNWRHQRVKEASGEIDITEETLREIIAGAGFDPQDGLVRESLMDAVNDAISVLPPAQRTVVEAQVFGGKSFREIADATGVSIDTLTARKRYALRNLSRALRHWVDD